MCLLQRTYKKTPDRDISPLPPVFQTNTYFKTQRLLDIPAYAIANRVGPDNFDIPQSEAAVIMGEFSRQ